MMRVSRLSACLLLLVVALPASATGAKAGNEESTASNDPGQVKGGERAIAEIPSNDPEEADPSSKPIETGYVRQTEAAPSSILSLLLAGGAILLAILTIALMFWLIGGTKRRIQDLEKNFFKLKSDLWGLQNPTTPRSPGYGRDAVAQPTAGGDEYRAAYAWPGEDSPPPTPVRPAPARPTPTPKPRSEPGRHPPVPAPRGASPAVALTPLQDELGRLIAAPGMRSADYDALLQRFGTLHGYDATQEDGSGELTAADADPTRRLTALKLSNSDIVAILPSARFIREFVLYKERLEAGNDVKTVFDLEADGTAVLRIGELAHGRATSDGMVTMVYRGLLGGFLR